MAEKALDQVARVALKWNEHHQFQPRSNADRNRVIKPTHEMKNYRRLHKGCSYEDSSESVWRRVKWPRSKTTIQLPHRFDEDDARYMQPDEGNSYEREME